jgi:hypothetical protein
MDMKTVIMFSKTENAFIAYGTEKEVNISDLY